MAHDAWWSRCHQLHLLTIGHSGWSVRWTPVLLSDAKHVEESSAVDAESAKLFQNHTNTHTHTHLSA